MPPPDANGGWTYSRSRNPRSWASTQAYGPRAPSSRRKRHCSEVPVGAVDVVGRGDIPGRLGQDVREAVAVDVDEVDPRERRTQILTHGGREPARGLVAEAPVTVVDEHLQRTARFVRGRPADDEITSLVGVEVGRDDRKCAAVGAERGRRKRSLMLREAAASVIQENLGVGRCPGTSEHEVGRSIAIEVREGARGETALRHRRRPGQEAAAKRREDVVDVAQDDRTRQHAGPRTGNWRHRGRDRSRHRRRHPPPPRSAPRSTARAARQSRPRGWCPHPCSTAAARRGSGGAVSPRRGNEHVEHAVAVEVRKNHVARLRDRGASEERRRGLLIQPLVVDQDRHLTRLSTAVSVGDDHVLTPVAGEIHTAHLDDLRGPLRRSRLLSPPSSTAAHSETTRPVRRRQRRGTPPPERADN